MMGKKEEDLVAPPPGIYAFAFTTLDRVSSVRASSNCSTWTTLAHGRPRARFERSQQDLPGLSDGYHNELEDRRRQLHSRPSVVDMAVMQLDIADRVVVASSPPLVVPHPHVTRVSHGPCLHNNKDGSSMEVC